MSAATADLTPRQAEVLAYIIGRIREDGGPPSYREVAGHFGFRGSGSAVLCHLRPLARKGYVSLVKDASRSVRVLRDPDGAPFAYPAAGADPVPGLAPPTARQAEVLRHLVAYVGARGYAPTIREVMGEFGFRSTNAVVAHLRALVRKGYLTRGPKGRSRSLRVLALRPPGEVP